MRNILLLQSITCLNLSILNTLSLDLWIFYFLTLFKYLLKYHFIEGPPDYHLKTAHHHHFVSPHPSLLFFKALSLLKLHLYVSTFLTLEYKLNDGSDFHCLHNCWWVNYQNSPCIMVGFEEVSMRLKKTSSTYKKFRL